MSRDFTVFSMGFIVILFSFSSMWLCLFWLEKELKRANNIICAILKNKDIIDKYIVLDEKPAKKERVKEEIEEVYEGKEKENSFYA